MKKKKAPSTPQPHSAPFRSAKTADSGHASRVAKAEIDRFRAQISEKIRKNPDKASRILSNWLTTRSSKKKKSA